MGRVFSIATANTSRAATWKNREVDWAAFCERLRDVRRTSETTAEYRQMAKPERDRAKDGPAFVAGRLQGGRRRKGHVMGRSMVVLDADRSDGDLWADWQMLVGAAAALYPTHSSTPGRPKHRLVIPLSRDVSADEYVPLAMRIADAIGASRFDETTYQPERLMYFPSASADAPFEVQVADGAFLDPDEWLALYSDWRDASCWPVQFEGARRRAEKAPDPRGKKGAVGAFCRAYTIEETIETHLGDVYVPAAREGRYTYAHGSSYAGLACYSGTWAYSNHATDPAAGRLANAFDLVRIHRFGELDEDVSEDAPVTSLPSYGAMCEWAVGLDAVSVEMARAAADDAAADFGEEAVDDAWKAKLAKNAKTGAIEPSAGNILLILQEDANIAGKLCRDAESRAIWVRGEALPWRSIQGGADLWSDEDDASLRLYVETHYGIAAKGKLDDAVSHMATETPYDPLRERLESLPVWDGVPRAETLLIDALGAEDCEYTRQVTRKTLAGAVRRALEPGCKWDYMLILEGAQGLGKSSFWELLAGRAFFTDSLTLKDIEYPKVAGEKIRGKWIAEVAELDGMAKASIERLKGWLSTKADNYRAAYARHAAVYQRRCIVVGTVNNLDGYLRDATGNRRFWPVRVSRELDRELLTQSYIDQVWAEAKELLTTERLYLEGDVRAQAEARQREAMETDPNEHLIRAYLETPIPEGFNSWALEDREAFWDAPDAYEGEALPREGVSIPEIWHEALRRPQGSSTLQDSRRISAILRKLGWEPKGRTERTKAYKVTKMFGPIAKA